MCGISAYIGKEDAAPILLDAIKKLEYRGYDSCGIATLEGSDLYIKKGIGRINEVDSRLDLYSLLGNIGIAHTRWATHGMPSDINAHPHLSKDVAIVHNGIIENSDELRKVLENKGHHFESETDTEVVVHLVQDFIDQGNSMGDAFMKALKMVEGAFAIVALNKNKPHKLYVAKQSSPLVLGIGEGEIFVASDTMPILPKTKKVVYLQDGDVGIITKDNYSIRDLRNIDVDRNMITLSEDIEEVTKQGFDHFMLKEIFEQPKTISRAFKGRINGGFPKLDGLLDGFSEGEFKDVKRVILLGCGTSWHACLVGSYWFEDLTKIPCVVEYASEFRYRKPILKEGDLVIALSQSGETADTIAALEEAKSKGIRTAGIVNVVGSTISRMVDSGVYMRAGHEVGVASTKAFTSNLVILFMISVLMGKIKGTIETEKIRELMNELERIPGYVGEILNDSGKIENIAEKYFNASNALYLGRNYNFPIALEGALKLKEISYIHAEGYPAAEMKHGPIALIDENMPVVVIAPEGRLYQKVLSNIAEVKSRKGKVIVITTNGLGNGFDEVIKIPKVSEYLVPLLSVIPTQLLAYYIAKKRGCDIDKPRNLAKSVTVE